MDTDDSVVKAKEGGPEAGWKKAQEAKVGDISHSVNHQVGFF